MTLVCFGWYSVFEPSGFERGVGVGSVGRRVSGSGIVL